MRNRRELATVAARGAGTGTGSPAAAAWSRARRGLLACLVFTAAVLLAPSEGRAEVSTFGSPLEVPATIGFHAGTDTALWNAAQLSGAPQAPETGQALKVSLEGCADPDPGGPAPLTQVHFQDLSPVPGGGARVNLTSQPFEVPVCGQDGASGSTISTYAPTNLCVSSGDYVDFDDEGGFVEGAYPDGVSYDVVGAVVGSTMDSFVGVGATGNGATMSSSQGTASGEGFVANGNEELMLQVTLGTGADASPTCRGAAVEAPSTGKSETPQVPIEIPPQTDGVNRRRAVTVAIGCRSEGECSGVAWLLGGGGKAGTRHVTFTLPGRTTGHVPIQLTKAEMSSLGRYHGAHLTLVVTLGGQRFSRKILVKIL